MPTVLVVDNGEEKSFELNDGELIFDGLENQGYSLPHGCLAGSCGSCRINILEGSENLSKPSAIEGDTLNTIENTYKESHGDEFLNDKHIRLSCRTKINGNIKIEKIKR